VQLEQFEREAGRMWDDIPAPMKEGIEALSVEGRAVSHPSFEGVYTLGECLTDYWPSGFGGEGDMRSTLVLYHGSFHSLAAIDPTFDWGGELWETILHELLHHREAAAGESGLDDFDWAEEQNRLRLAGRSYDPSFYRAVPAAADGTVRLDSELFLEASIGRGATEVPFNWRGRTYSVRVPREAGLAFVDVTNLAGGRLCLVVRRVRPWWSRWRGERPRDPVELRGRALPVPIA
jgi:hypothetical protein